MHDGNEEDDDEDDENAEDRENLVRNIWYYSMALTCVDSLRQLSLQYMFGSSIIEWLYKYTICKLYRVLFLII